MKIRNAKLRDHEIIKKLVHENQLKTSYADLKGIINRATNSYLLEDEGVKGFVLVRALPSVNELLLWHLNPEHKLALKAITKQINGPIAVHEAESSKERIQLLEENGFKTISRINGLINDETAVTLRLD